MKDASHDLLFVRAGSEAHPIRVGPSRSRQFRLRWSRVRPRYRLSVSGEPRHTMCPVDHRLRMARFPEISRPPRGLLRGRPKSLASNRSSVLVHEALLGAVVEG